MINKGIVRQFLAAIAGKEIYEIFVLYIGTVAREHRHKTSPSCNDKGRIIFSVGLWQLFINIHV